MEFHFRPHSLCMYISEIAHLLKIRVENQNIPLHSLFTLITLLTHNALSSRHNTHYHTSKTSTPHHSPPFLLLSSHSHHHSHPTTPLSLPSTQQSNRNPNGSFIKHIHRSSRSHTLTHTQGSRPSHSTHAPLPPSTISGEDHANRIMHRMYIHSLHFKLTSPFNSSRCAAHKRGAYVPVW